MRLVLISVLFFASALCAVSGQVSLTAKEIGLMLRSGYSSEAVLRELSARKFADTLDPTTEKQLVQAGATPKLIEVLRSGAYQLPPSEIAAVKAKLAAQEERGAEAMQPSKQAESAKADARGRSDAPVDAHPADAIYQRLKDDLVYSRQGSVTHFDDETLEHKKLYLLFFSATWSGPGRKFTPQLVEYYNRVAPEHPEFEVVFFSADRSQFAMETYMAQSNMPWPAIAYDKLAGKAGDIQKNLVREIPCLILADATGKILSHSRSDENSFDTGKVLADLDQILARNSGGPAAPTR
jgi:thiol-disulfide isomerase/thioredoxin